MKIIGGTESGFILEATKDEVANLAGYYSYNHAPDKGYHKDAFNIGDQVNVDAMYRQLYSLARLGDQVESTKKTLEAAIQLLTIVDPVIRKVVDMQPDEAA